MGGNRIVVAVLALLCLLIAGAGARLLNRERRPSGSAGHGGGFTDVTAAAGITFRFQRQPASILETVAPGAALWDFDGDGWLDIFLVGQNGATATGGGALYRNRGMGESGLGFEDVTTRSGLGVAGRWMGCAVGDVDNDGRPDLFLSGFGECRLFRNLGAGRFRDITRESGLASPSSDAWATSAAFADADRDGRLDLAVGRYAHYRPLEKEEKWWSPSHFAPQRGSIYLNRGAPGGRSGFVDATRRMGLANSTGKTLGVAFADVDDDGFPDLYLANDEVPCDLYMNRGGNGFVNRGVVSGTAYNFNGRAQAGMGVDWGDVTGDGKLDLVVTTFEKEPSSLYQNDGGGFFTHISFRSGFAPPTIPYVGWGTCFLDYDRDGLLDLLCVNGHVRPNADETGAAAGFAQPLQLFRGQGEGRLVLASGPEGIDLGPPMVARGLASGDVDSDGDPDLLVAGMNGPPRLLRNDVASPNAWAGFRLQATRGNRMAVGARVTVSAGGRTQVRHVTATGSYLSASDSRALFGLGTASRVDYVEIRWPDGTTERRTDATPGQYQTIVGPPPAARHD